MGGAGRSYRGSERRGMLSHTGSSGRGDNGGRDGDYQDDDDDDN